MDIFHRITMSAEKINDICYSSILVIGTTADVIHYDNVTV